MTHNNAVVASREDEKGCREREEAESSSGTGRSPGSFVAKEELSQIGRLGRKRIQVDEYWMQETRRPGGRSRASSRGTVTGDEGGVRALNASRH